MFKNISKNESLLCAAVPTVSAAAIWAFSAWYKARAVSPPITGGNQQLMLLKNSALLFAFFAAGFLLLWLLREKNSLLDVFILSLPVGMGYVFAVCFVILNLNVRFCAASVLFGVLAGLAAVACAARKRERPREGFGKLKLIAALSAAAALCVLCCALPLRAFSDDSVHYYTLCPRIIAASGALPYYYSHCFVSVGLLEPLLAAVGYLFSAFIPFGLQNALCVCMFLYITRSASSAFKGKRLATLLAGAVVLCCVFLQPALLMLQTYLWSNLFGAAYLLFSAALIGKISGGESRFENEAALMIILLGFSFTRLEGFAYALLLFMIFARGKTENKRLIVLFLLPQAAFYCLYFFNLYVIHGIPDSSMFLSRRFSLLILLIYAAAAVYAVFLRKRDFLKTRSGVWAYIIAGLLALLALGAALYPERFSTNVSHILHNTLSAESWGTAGAVIIVAYIAALTWSRFKITALDICVITFPLMVFDVCLFVRDALGTSPFDSSNRLLIQLIPLACLAIAEKLAGNATGGKDGFVSQKAM